MNKSNIFFGLLSYFVFFIDHIVAFASAHKGDFNNQNHGCQFSFSTCYLNGLLFPIGK